MTQSAIEQLDSALALLRRIEGSGCALSQSLRIEIETMLLDADGKLCPECQGEKRAEDDHCHPCTNWLAGREP